MVEVEVEVAFFSAKRWDHRNRADLIRGWNQCQRITRRPLGTDQNRKVISKKKKKQRSRVVHKDVIFVSDAWQTKVPTHKTRLALEKKGRVIHNFPFKTDWDQFELCAAVERELPVLATRDYEFLKVIH